MAFGKTHLNPTQPQPTSTHPKTHELHRKSTDPANPSCRSNPNSVHQVAVFFSLPLTDSDPKRQDVQKGCQLHFNGGSHHTLRCLSEMVPRPKRWCKASVGDFAAWQGWHHSWGCQSRCVSTVRGPPDGSSEPSLKSSEPEVHAATSQC